MTKVIARHGDMIIFKISKEQVEGKEQVSLKKLTVGLGETTGHSHEIFALDNSEVIEHHNVAGYDSAEIQKLVERENIYFEVKGQAVIMHEEHGPIILEEGFYVRTVQRQYNPFKRALEKVRD